MNEMDGQSRDNVRARIEELKKPFPEAVSEGRLDYDMLMALLGDDFDNDSEKYQFTWKGKLDSLRLAQKRSAATLRPCQGESLNWETTKNLYIEGDNLEVLKLLQQGYLRKVKLIYIDPSYNTGNDFAYEDDFSDPIKQYCAQTGRVLRANPETAGRYHSKWLSMMYPRLKIAKTLLRDDGVIFISIDDNEQHNLRKLCDEVFGEENFVANILWQKRYSPANDHLTICPMHDFILVYRKSDAWQRNLLARTEENDKQYRYEDERGVFRPDNDKCNKTAAERPNLYYPIIHPVTGEEVWPSKDAVWRYSIERHEENVRQNMVFWGKDGTAKVPSFKRYRDMLRNGGGTVPSTWWAFEFAGHNDETAKETSELIGSRVFSTPKPVKLLKQILALGSSDGDLVLDFFSGSAAMAQAVMEMNASSDAETDS
ncbi:MAG: site-specific DNA-methyltransferase, partial [Clostridia bacterium]